MISEQIRDLYEHIFSPMTNREFLNYWDHGKLHHTDKETLITTGGTQSDLMLILNGNATVVREGNNIASLKRRQFIAEISYIIGKPASADVISKEELTVFVWNRSV